MKLKYLGHSAFEISILDYKILIDPFLIKSPDYDYSKTTDIFVTHGHGDHLGDSIKISKETKNKREIWNERISYVSRCARRL